jgi:hypothetical protein
MMVQGVVHRDCTSQARKEPPLSNQTLSRQSVERDSRCSRPTAAPERRLSFIGTERPAKVHAPSITPDAPIPPTVWCGRHALGLTNNAEMLPSMQ